jgi:hypothetical protein
MGPLVICFGSLLYFPSLQSQKIVERLTFTCVYEAAKLDRLLSTAGIAVHNVKTRNDTKLIRFFFFETSDSIYCYNYLLDFYWC